MKGLIDIEVLRGLFRQQREVYMCLVLMADDEGMITMPVKDVAAKIGKKQTLVTNLLHLFAQRGLMEHVGKQWRVTSVLRKVEDESGEPKVTMIDFETWWKAYDKKVSKDACQKVWSKMGVRDKRACLESTPLYVASTPDKQYRKNPLTYLHQKSWNDEIINPTNNGNGYGQHTDAGNRRSDREQRRHTEQMQRIGEYADVAAEFRQQSLFDQEVRRSR